MKVSGLFPTPVGTFDLENSEELNKGLAEFIYEFRDQRIKENIRDVPDNASLQKLRDISCCFYEAHSGPDRILNGSNHSMLQTRRCMRG